MRKHQRRWRLAGIGITAAIATIASLATSTAAPAAGLPVDQHPHAQAHDHDPDPGGTARGTAASEATDIGIIAADKGWSLEATRRQMADQHAFGNLQNQIETRFPTSFAGAEFATSPGGRSFLRFKGAVPAAAEALATESGLDVGLTGGRRYSSAELADRTVASVKFFEAAGYPQVAAAVLRDGLIDIAVSGVAKPGVELPPALADGARVTYTEREVAGNLHTYGGAKISGGGFQCTTGFTVRSLITGTMGVTAAAHCTGMNTYDQPNTSPLISYLTSFQAQHIGLSGDVEWHVPSVHQILPEYYASPSDRRQVNSVETTAAVNNTYCLYSRMQGTRTCDQVYSTYIATLTGVGLATNLVGMDDMNGIGGDSGGPWSYGTEAAGTVCGWIWVPFGNHDTWSKAWLFDSALGIEVMV